jgi:hypothetical protein
MDSIGNYLKRAREEKKIPLPQVSRDTKINERYLIAIENDEFTVLPAPTYTRGFIKIYAEYLGLAAQPLVDQFMREHVGISKQSFSIEGDAMAGDAASRPWRFTGIGVAAAVGVVIVVFALVSMWKSCSRAPLIKPQMEKEEIETLPLPPVPTVVSENAAPVKEVKDEGQRKLVAKALDDVWVKVYADGELQFQDIIPKGREESWVAMEEFHLRVGRPKSIKLLLDGKEIENLKDAKQRNLIIDKQGKITFYDGKMKER